MNASNPYNKEDAEIKEHADLEKHLARAQRSCDYLTQGSAPSQ